MRSARTLILVALALLLTALPAARAQSLDVFAGLNALTARQAISNIPQLGGGLFPSAGVNLFIGAVGIGGEVAFRAQHNSSDLRPIYYDVNLLLDPVHIARSIVPELMVGVGAQSIQALKGAASCGGLSSCAQYAGSNLAGHVGLGLKVYLTEHIFLRPEAHFYFIRNNSAFGTSNTQRFGVSLGYSFGS